MTSSTSHEGIKHRTVAIQKSIETGERHPLSHFDTRRYVQHNLALGDGFANLCAFLDSLPPGSSRVTPPRAYEDGDISFAHLEYVLAPMGRVVGFEVHRWEDGRIVEHWDNLQPSAPEPNASGRTMTDGPTEAGELDRTAANKEQVARFVRDVLIAGPTAGGTRETHLAEHFDGDRLAQHSPAAADGASSWLNALERGRHAGTLVYERLHRVLGEGDFCLAMSEGRSDGGPVAFYDLFRLQRDRIVEHWDVVEPIPPREQWRNDNGKF